MHSCIWRFCSKYKNVNKNILDNSDTEEVMDYNARFEGGFVLPLLGKIFTRLKKSSLQLRDRRSEGESRKKNIREKDAKDNYEVKGLLKVAHSLVLNFNYQFLKKK